MQQRMHTDLVINIADAEAVYACTVVYTYLPGCRQTYEDPGEEPSCEISSVTGRLVESRLNLATGKRSKSVAVNALEVNFLALLSDDALDDLSSACLEHYRGQLEAAAEVRAEMRREEMRVA